MGSVMSYALGLGPDRPAPAGILAFSGFVPTVEGWQPSLADRERPARVHRARAQRPDHGGLVRTRGTRSPGGRRTGRRVPRIRRGAPHRPRARARRGRLAPRHPSRARVTASSRLTAGRSAWVMGLFHKMLPVAGVLAALAVLDMLRPNLEFHAVLSLVITATGALWVAIGVSRHLPGRLGLILLAAATLNLAAIVAWFAPVLAGGDATLAQPSIADAGWLIGELAARRRAAGRAHPPRAAPVRLARRRDDRRRSRPGRRDRPDRAQHRSSTATTAVQITQICYVVSDILIASMVRARAARPGRPAGGAVAPRPPAAQGSWCPTSPGSG